MRKVAQPITFGALALTAALAGCEAWLITYLVRRHGRTLLDQERMTERLTAIERVLLDLATKGDGHTQQHEPAPAQQPTPAGLAVGSLAPPFSLPDLSGQPRTLTDLRGAPALLTFFSPDCGYCQQLAPQLGQLPDGSHHLVVISRGDVERNRQLAVANGWKAEVLLDQSSEVANSYHIYGTPMAYLLDSDGRVASEVAVGGPAILALTSGPVHPAGETDGDLTAASLRAKEEAAARRLRDAGLSVAASQLNRAGLTAGTAAPDFRLRDLGGKERTLADFRGAPFLLVFSDADCGPCQALAPSLETLHTRKTEALQVVMVSRGNYDENRRKAAEHGLTFPVLLQQRWEVSQQYGIFATPVAFLVDRDGQLAADVAIGGDAILKLAGRASDLQRAPLVEAR